MIDSQAGGEGVLRETDTLVLNPDLEFKEKSGKYFCFHPDTRCIHKLNRTAYGILSLCDGTRTVREVVDWVIDHCPSSDPEFIRNDVLKCLREFLGKNFFSSAGSS